MTDRDPIREQMARYTKMLLFPCLGATENMRYNITAIAVVQYSRNPAPSNRARTQTHCITLSNSYAFN